MCCNALMTSLPSYVLLWPEQTTFHVTLAGITDVVCARIKTSKPIRGVRSGRVQTTSGRDAVGEPRRHCHVCISQRWH